MTGNPNVLFAMEYERRNDVTLHQWHPLVQAPDIDAFRRKGPAFSRALCETPTGVPSRGSFSVGEYRYGGRGFFG